jgi:transcriptional regulator NrdR family protein
MADYFHCMMHKLNLSAASVIEDLNIRHAHATVKKVGTFFNSSAKRVDLLKSCVAKEDDSRITKNRLLTLSVTRFIERHQAIGTMRNLLPFIIESLEIMETWESSNTRNDARNLLSGLLSSKTVTSIVMLEHITAVLQPVSEQLQSLQQDLIQSMEMVGGVVEQLKNMKEGTYFADRVFPEVLSLASKFDFQITVPRRRTTMPEFIDTDNVCDFYETIWRGAIKNVVNDLSLKFDNTEKAFLASFQKIMPHTIEKYTDFYEVAENLVTKYQELIGEFDLLTVERELARWGNKWCKTPSDERPSTVLATLNHSFTSTFPHVQKFLIILATLPVTTAEPERVFSKVNLTKSAIRASMSSERMENLVLIQSHRDVIPSVEEVVVRYLGKQRKILQQNKKAS